MINQRIAYTQDDGTLAIIIPAPEFIAKGSTLERLLERSVPVDAHFDVLHAEDIPQDRYFRKAWCCNQGRLEIDRPKAESIHMDKLREKRNERLKEEDIEYQKALEFRDDAKMNAVANRKKKLRDMPQDVDLSKLSLDELKVYIPAVLKDIVK